MAQIPDTATLKKLKVQELKDLLLENNLSVVGKKDDLIQRLADKALLLHLHQQQKQLPEDLEKQTASKVAPAAAAANVTSSSPVRVTASAGEPTAAKDTEEPEVITKASGFTFRKLSFDAAGSSTSPTTAAAATAGGTAGSTTAADAEKNASKITPPSPAKKNFGAGASSNGVGLPSSANKPATSSLSADDLDKRKKRAARFGLPATETDRLAERALRFGVGQSSTAEASEAAIPTAPASAPASTTTDASKGKSSGGALTPEALAEEEKKRKRAARFATTPAITPDSKKVKT